MNAVSLVLLLVELVCLASGSQTPLTLSLDNGADNWDKEPDADATGNRIFNSASELLQLWPGTVVVQGHSLAPCIIPAGHIFYHGRGNKYMPNEPEWLAFDFEHSYFFAWGRDPHVLTLAAKRPLRILNFDGLSAHLSGETQTIIMYGEVRQGHIPTHEISNRLCTWAAQHGIDGFIRMEEHFELIECDFASSFELLESLRIIPQDERTKDERRIPGERVKRPDGWIGSLPTNSQKEVDVAGKWHDRAPGETRVRVQYDKFVSFYDPAVTSLVESRRGKPREQQNLTTLSRADAQMKLAELEAALARPWDAGSGVDWASVLHVVVERYGERLELLAHTLNSTTRSSYEIAYKARQQVLMMLTPHFTIEDTPGSGVGSNKAWLAPVVQRCASMQTRGLPPNGLLSPQEVLLRGAVEDVMNEICRRLARMFALAYDIEEESEKINASSVASAMLAEVTDLMTWLDWTQVWVKCKPACTIEELCLIPGHTPFGGGGDRRNPKCVRKPNA
ncbi:hypothetical protein R3P38DRAFT_2859108 [Favolaschia claudopus]|uniref:Uncharacterized protein n=1 Tax=Favolaschia claudopus TaxID=2862362 RepID=A0AAW0DMC4_9AGAR